eukprot:Sspe_Gene.43601::Locus_21274_Transcript_2_4_Confidence_0.286_Length_1201::g.43601::m.43601
MEHALQHNDQTFRAIEQLYPKHHPAYAVGLLARGSLLVEANQLTMAEDILQRWAQGTFLRCGYPPDLGPTCPWSAWDAPVTQARGYLLLASIFYPHRYKSLTEQGRCPHPEIIQGVLASAERYSFVALQVCEKAGLGYDNPTTAKAVEALAVIFRAARKNDECTALLTKYNLKHTDVGL